MKVVVVAEWITRSTRNRKTVSSNPGPVTRICVVCASLLSAVRAAALRPPLVRWIGVDFKLCLSTALWFTVRSAGTWPDEVTILVVRRVTNSTVAFPSFIPHTRSLSVSLSPSLVVAQV